MRIPMLRTGSPIRFAFHTAHCSHSALVNTCTFTGKDMEGRSEQRLIAGLGSLHHKSQRPFPAVNCFQFRICTCLSFPSFSPLYPGLAVFHSSLVKNSLSR